MCRSAPRGFDQEDVGRGVAPGVGTLGLDVRADNPDPCGAPDLDGLAHAVGAGEGLSVDDGRDLPERKRRLAALVGVVEAVVRGDFASQRDEFFGGAEAAGSVFGAGVESPRAVFHAGAHEFRHLGDLGRGGGALVVVAHDHAAHGGVADHGDDVRGDARRVVRVHLVRDGPHGIAPVGTEDGRRDPLHDQVVGAPSLDVVGREDAVGVRVHVDEAGHDVLPRRVDDAGGGCVGELADGDDLVVVDADVGGECWAARAVEHLAAPDEDVEVLAGGGGGEEEEGEEGLASERDGAGASVHGTLQGLLT